MGKFNTTSQDSAKQLVSGTFSATGVSNSAVFTGQFNILIGTFTGTIQIENSYDGGATWNAVTGGVFTGATNTVGVEPEVGVLLRFNCTALASGTPAYRISQ